MVFETKDDQKIDIVKFTLSKTFFALFFLENPLKHHETIRYYRT